MESIRNDVIGGFNRFVEDQKSVPGDCRLTLVQFDTQDAYEVVRDNVPIAEVLPLDSGSYVPRAGTPLYDAIGRAIVNAGQRLKNAGESCPNKVVFVIMTDGHENSSKEYSRAKVMEMIKLQTETYKWQVVYLGANQDAMAVGGTIGIVAANAMNLTADSRGISSAYEATSGNLRSYRTGVRKDMAWSAEQRNEQEAASAAN